MGNHKQWKFKQFCIFSRRDGFLGLNKQGVFTGNGGPITTIADTGTFPGGGFQTPSMNSSGTVAFSADSIVNGAGIFTGSGGPLTTIADTSGPLAGYLVMGTLFPQQGMGTP